MITKEIFEFKDDNKTLYYAAYNEYDNIIKRDNKFYAKVKCRKCHGEGKIAPFIHIAKGTCFDCKGEGYQLIRLYTATNKETIERRLQKEIQKEQENEQKSKLTFNDASLRRTLDMYGEDFYLILDTKDKSTYHNKEALKEDGCRWNSFFGAWYNKGKEIEGFHNIKIHTKDYLTGDNILKVDKIKEIVDNYRKSIGLK